MSDRLDRALVARGLADSRARAQAMIAEGLVAVAGRPATRPAQKVDAAAVTLTARPAPWVGRAALKLLHALDHFALSPEGAVCADIGASTGGFTQVLLARGAARVHAYDVGRGQMHPGVAADPRVDANEGVNARHLDPGVLPAFDWVVCDVSFISSTLALGPALAAARPGATLVTLVKPQFELQRAALSRGGIVRDAASRDRAAARVSAWLDSRGWAVLGCIESPVAGGDGNRERLLAARRTG